MKITWLNIILFGLAGLGLGAPASAAVKIGVMTDMAGGSADLAGKGSVVAAEMAIEDFGGSVLGKPIELVSVDHQAKPDIALSLARKWFDIDNVSMIVDLPTSSAALAVQELAKEKNKITIVATGATTELTKKACSPTGFHWAYDTYSNSYPLARDLIARGEKDFYYVTVDYAFGKSLEENFRNAVDEYGGKSVGSTKHPLNAGDMSSQILFAQSSGADVIVLANAGADLINGMKAASEFGIIKGGQAVVIPVAFLTDIKSMGLELAQGLQYVDAFRLDRNAETKEFVQRFIDRAGKGPTMTHIGVYSGIMHYLKSVKEVGDDNADKVADKMREIPVNDIMTENGKVRKDGRMVHDMYVVQVKTPNESSGPWDLVKYLSTIPGDIAFAPISDECEFAKEN